jgi:hypothetical protein
MTSNEQVTLAFRAQIARGGSILGGSLTPQADF